MVPYELIFYVDVPCAKWEFRIVYEADGDLGVALQLRLVRSSLSSLRRDCKSGRELIRLLQQIQSQWLT